MRAPGLGPGGGVSHWKLRTRPGQDREARAASRALASLASYDS
ncbi:hypothetical protein [Corallococcus sp. EGB]|nr:hypothetical protein [Corallococcus sp. EGB]